MKTSLLDIDKTTLLLCGSESKPKSRRSCSLFAFPGSRFCYVHEDLAKIVRMSFGVTNVQVNVCGLSDKLIEKHIWFALITIDLPWLKSYQLLIIVCSWMRKTYMRAPLSMKTVLIQSTI
jgi:hypothetical protein